MGSDPHGVRLDIRTFIDILYAWHVNLAFIIPELFIT